MSSINPNFQAAKFSDALPSDLLTAKSLVVKDGKIAKQSTAGKIFTSLARAAPGGSLFIKYQNHKTLKNLTNSLMASGLDKGEVKSLIGKIKIDSGIAYGVNIVSGQHLQAIADHMNQLETNSSSVKSSIDTSMAKAVELGHSKLEGVIMGLVNAGGSIAELSGNQLAPLADEIVKSLLPDNPAHSLEDKIDVIEGQLESLNGLHLKNLIADMAEGILAKDGDEGKITPNPQAADLMNLVKYKLNCRLTALRPQGEAVFVQNPPSTLTPKLRREHLFETLKSDNPLPQAMEQYGVKAKTPQTIFDSYCKNLSGDGSTSFLRDTNPASSFLDFVRTPLKAFTSQIKEFASTQVKTDSGDEFEPVPESKEYTARPQIYTKEYEEKLQNSVQKFMEILDINPSQKAEFIAAVKSINQAFANAIDFRGDLANPEARKIEALNSILQRSLNSILPSDTPEEAIKTAEFTKHISRAILLTSPKHVEATVFNNFRAMFT